MVLKVNWRADRISTDSPSDVSVFFNNLSGEGRTIFDVIPDANARTLLIVSFVEKECKDA